MHQTARLEHHSRVRVGLKANMVYINDCQPCHRQRAAHRTVRRVFEYLEIPEFSGRFVIDPGRHHAMLDIEDDCGRNFCAERMGFHVQGGARIIGSPVALRVPFTATRRIGAEANDR
jgi:hypothetical protein